ncbi:MAG: hypothetical protein HEQ14_03340 [Aphanizomenon flos-aquae CP01]|nr:hypothetical protein [Aphanizomenon flos-aquae CP01]
MLNYISKLMTSDKFKVPIVGLIIAVGFLGINYSSQQHYKLLSSKVLATNPALLSGPQETKEEPVQESSVKNYYHTSTEFTNTGKLERKEKIQFPEEDGIYLYGESLTPNQLGQGYIIFQKQQDKIIGALYFPQSEFTCFQGKLTKSGELAMMVRTLPGEVGTMEVATISTIPKINENEFATYPYSVTLQDYYRLSSVSSHDREILQICQQGSDGFR